MDAVVAKIGERMHATPAQVIMLWVRAKGVVIVTYVVPFQFIPECK